MPWYDDLIARRKNITAELKALVATSPGGKPNNSGEVAGTDHVGYKDGLYRELAQIDKFLRDAGVDADGNVNGGETITEAFAT